MARKLPSELATYLSNNDLEAALKNISVLELPAGSIQTSRRYAGLARDWKEAQKAAAKVREKLDLYGLTLDSGDSSAPSASDPTLEVTGSDRIKVSWPDASETDFSHWTLYRGTSTGFTPGAGNKVGDFLGLEHIDTGLSADTEYFYVLRWHDVNGNSADSNEVSATTEAAT